MQAVLADYAISVTELKRNFSSVISEANGAVAVLNHNKPEAYLLPAAHYEALLNLLEDLEDAKLVVQRLNETPVEVSIDDL